MGLSMDERRALEEIERQLAEEDPRFAARLQAPERGPERTGPRDRVPWTVRPERAMALASWNAIAVAVILFLLAGVVHAELLTGVGLVLLLTGLGGLVSRRRKRGQEPPKR